MYERTGQGMNIPPQWPGSLPLYYTYSTVSRSPALELFPVCWPDSRAQYRLKTIKKILYKYRINKLSKMGRVNRSILDHMNAIL